MSRRYFWCLFGIIAFSSVFHFPLFFTANQFLWDGSVVTHYLARNATGYLRRWQESAGIPFYAEVLEVLGHHWFPNLETAYASLIFVVLSLFGVVVFWSIVESRYFSLKESVVVGLLAIASPVVSAWPAAILLPYGLMALLCHLSATLYALGWKYQRGRLGIPFIALSLVIYFVSCSFKVNLLYGPCLFFALILLHSHPSEWPCRRVLLRVFLRTLPILFLSALFWWWCQRYYPLSPPYSDYNIPRLRPETLPLFFHNFTVAYQNIVLALSAALLGSHPLASGLIGIVVLSFLCFLRKSSFSSAIRSRSLQVVLLGLFLYAGASLPYALVGKSSQMEGIGSRHSISYLFPLSLILFGTAVGAAQVIRGARVPRTLLSLLAGIFLIGSTVLAHGRGFLWLLRKAEDHALADFFGQSLETRKYSYFIVRGKPELGPPGFFKRRFYEYTLLINSTVSPQFRWFALDEQDLRRYGNFKASLKGYRNLLEVTRTDYLLSHVSTVGKVGVLEKSFSGTTIPSPLLLYRHLSLDRFSQLKSQFLFTVTENLPAQMSQ